jgi:hypothetical protein
MFEFIFLLFLVIIPLTGWILGIIAFFRTRSKSDQINLLSRKLTNLENQLKKIETQILNINLHESINPKINTNISNLVTDKLTTLEQLNTDITKNQDLETKNNNTKYYEDYEPSGFEKLLTWLSTDWLMKLGAFMVFLAVTWFFGIAFVNFSNEFKILTVLLGALATFIFGLTQFTKNKDVGQVLVALGAIVSVCTFSFGYYQFEIIPPILVSIASIVVIGLTYYVANIKKSLPLAVLATIGFYTVPFLAIDSNPNYISLGLYLVIINVFILATTIINKWEILITISTIFTGFFLTSMTIANQDAIKTLISPIFLIVSANIALLYLFNIFYSAKKENFGPLTVFNSIVVTLFTAIVIPAFFYDDIANLSLIITAFILFAVAVFLYITNINKSFIYIQVCASLALVVIATCSILISQSFMPVIIGLEFLIALVGLYYIFKDRIVFIVFNVLQLFPVIAVFLISFGTNMNLIWFYVYLFILIGQLYFNYANNNENNNEVFANIYGAIIGVLLARLIWISVQALIPGNPTFVVIVAMILYTIIGVFLSFIFKLEKKFQSLHYYGYALLIFVIARLFLIDIWNMNVESRIIVFVLVGILFISTPFLRKINKN